MMDTTDGKSKIVEKAIEMFNSLGCKGVTMDQIATSLHISKRTLYETFGNKEDLLMDCLVEVHRRIGEQRMGIFRQTDDPLLLTLCIVRSTFEHRSAYSRILNDAKLYYPGLNGRILNQFGVKFKEALHTILISAAEHGDLRENIDVENAVNIISKSVQDFFMNGAEKERWNRQAISDVLYTYLRGLLSVQAIERYDKREAEFRRLLETTE